MQQGIERETGVEDAPAMIEVGLRNAYDASEYASIEQSLREFHGISAVHLDRTRGVAHVTYGDYPLRVGVCHFGGIIFRTFTYY